MWLKMTNAKYHPEWKKFEKDIYSENPQKAREAAEAFDETRAHELKNSQKARDWEKSRREAVAKNKPHYVKERLNKEQQELLKPFMSLKQAGKFDTGLVPMPGYIIVILDEQQKTESGIYLADEAVIQNTARVLAVGNGVLLDSGKYVELPVSPGEVVMFKRGAGLEMEIKDRKCRFMMFSDILAKESDE